MKVNVKKLDSNAVVPTYAKHGDAGMDLTATSKSYDEHGNVVYGTGLAFEIPTGYVGLLFPRSSNTKKDLILGNSVGVIDSGYRGEYMAPVTNLNTKRVVIKKQDVEYKEDAIIYPYEKAICQGVLLRMPQLESEEISFEELQSMESERMAGKLGSSGK